MQSIVIEPYSDVYQEPVINLILNIQQAEYDININLSQQPDLQSIPAFYQLGKGNFWVAHSANELVGTIALLDIGNSQVALRKMFVQQAYRGNASGTAQLLLNTALNWCSEKKIHDIFLGTTEKFTAAQRFYEKNGFNVIDKSRLPHAFPVMVVDVKFYSFKLHHQS